MNLENPHQVPLKKKKMSNSAPAPPEELSECAVQRGGSGDWIPTSAIQPNSCSSPDGGRDSPGIHPEEPRGKT